MSKLFIDFPKQEAKEASWKDTVGTIRSGRIDPYSKSPMSLNTWRLTCDTEDIAKTIAKEYGGEVTEWETKGSDRYEVITERDVIGVQLLSIKSELILWGQRKPVRVCDGATRIDDNHAGEGCKCAADYPVMWDRKTAAGDGEACKPNIQATMNLVDFPDLGIFKWQTSSWLVAEDYANWLDELATVKGTANMRIEQYVTKTNQPRQKTVFDGLEVEQATA